MGFAAVAWRFLGWKGVLVIILAALLGLQWVVFKTELGVCHAQLTASQKKVGDLQTENASLVAANRLFQVQVQNQNEAIDKLKAEGDQRVANAKAELAKIQKARDVWQGAFDTLLHAAPPPKEKECEATNMLLKDYFILRQKEEMQNALPSNPDPSPGPDGVRDDKDGVRPTTGGDTGPHALQGGSSGCAGIALCQRPGWEKHVRTGPSSLAGIGATPTLRSQVGSHNQGLYCPVV